MHAAEHAKKGGESLQRENRGAASEWLPVYQWELRQSAECDFVLQLVASLSPPHAQQPVCSPSFRVQRSPRPAPCLLSVKHKAVGLLELPCAAASPALTPT